MEKNALFSLDQASEISDAEVLLKEELSEDSPDKDRGASSTEVDSTIGPDAHGARTSQEPRSLGNSQRASPDALSGNQDPMRELSAGAPEVELSEDSSGMEDYALSGKKPEENGSDAAERESLEESSRNGLDKDNNVSPTKEETTDGPDAIGSEI